MSIDTLTADTNINRTSPQVAKKNWETAIPNGIQENEMPDTGTVDMDFSGTRGHRRSASAHPCRQHDIPRAYRRHDQERAAHNWRRSLWRRHRAGGRSPAPSSRKPPARTLANTCWRYFPVPATKHRSMLAIPPSRTRRPPLRPRPPKPPSQLQPLQPRPRPGPPWRRPATAGEVLMPAARAAAPAQRRIRNRKRGASRCPSAHPASCRSRCRWSRPGRRPRWIRRRSSVPPLNWHRSGRPRKPTASQAQPEPQGEARTLGQAQNQTAAWPPGGFCAKVPPELVADMMMNALDKYKQGARTGTTSMANSAGAARGASD